jgi:L-methionine (R)-S-oxide reductase
VTSVVDYRKMTMKLTPKPDLYNELASELTDLLAGESDLVANAANFAALVFHALPDLNWAGFYFVKDGELVLGPFQGRPACMRIAFGRGVCGTAAAKRVTTIVPNVHEFPGHIACDMESESEIVIPLIKNERFIGVLDLDSSQLSRFDEADAAGLETLITILLASTETDAS